MTEKLLLAQQKKLLITSPIMDFPGKVHKHTNTPVHTQLRGASRGELGNFVDGSLLHGWCEEGPSATFRKAELSGLVPGCPS